FRAARGQHRAGRLLRADLRAVGRTDHGAVLLRRGLHHPDRVLGAHLAAHHAAADRGDGADRNGGPAGRLVLRRDADQRDALQDGGDHGRDRCRRRHRQAGVRRDRPVQGVGAGLSDAAQHRLRQVSQGWRELLSQRDRGRSSGRVPPLQRGRREGADRRAEPDPVRARCRAGPRRARAGARRCASRPQRDAGADGSRQGLRQRWGNDQGTGGRFRALPRTGSLLEKDDLMNSIESHLAPTGLKERERTMQEITAYLAPRSLDEALQAMADGAATVLCGGTDLAPQTESGTRQYQATLLNIRRIEGLGGIEVKGDKVRIGAVTTISEIRRNALLAEIAPVLVEAAERFASDQIRNAASVGGNLCNASPAGDMIPPLLVLGASVELACWQDGAVQTRRIPLERFFVGPGKTVKLPEELLTVIVF